MGNRTGERDPEMHQTKKGNQWYIGMKAHIGVDADSGLAHSLETTPANTSDVAIAHALLHEGEEPVWGDAGYQGVGKREENRDPALDWEVAMKAGKRRQLDKSGAAGGGGEAQGVGAGEVGASVPVCEAPLRLRQGALPGVGEEHAANRRAARILQPPDRGALRRCLMRRQSVRHRCKAGETVGSGVETPASRQETRFRWPPACHTHAGRLECPLKHGLFRPTLTEGRTNCVTSSEPSHLKPGLQSREPGSPTYQNLSRLVITHSRFQQ